MTQPSSDLPQLLKTLNPQLNEGVYVFCCLCKDDKIPDVPIVGQFRESEETTLILSEADALKTGLKILFRFAWITLTVHSDLTAIGLTAAISAALTEDKISCNIVAGAHHDHLFVPIDQADAALISLRRVQESAAQGLASSKIKKRTHSNRS